MAVVYNVKGFFVLTLVLLASVRSENDRRALHSCLLYFSLPPLHISLSQNVWLVIRTPRATPWSRASFLRGGENTEKKKTSKQKKNTIKKPYSWGEGRVSNSSI